MWYRIELNKDRSVRSCVEVSGSISEGRSIHYIEADSKESAIAILAAGYDKRMQGARAREKDRKNRGLCRCCDQPAVTARHCRAHQLKSNERRRSVLTGAPARPVVRNASPEKKAELEAKVRANDALRKTQRIAAAGIGKYQFEHAVRARKTLAIVLAAFDRDPTSFRGWLVAKIAECQDKIDGKKSVADHMQAAE